MDQNTGAPVRNNLLALTAGLGVGAGLMYLFDPDRGLRRRRKLVDQAASLVPREADALKKSGHHLLDRARGLAAEVTSALTGEETVDDETLVARVRSRMGHVVSRPHEIEVEVRNGTVTLGGKLPHAERRALKRHIQEIPGVTAIRDHLEPRFSFSPGVLIGLAAGLILERGSRKNADIAEDQGC